MLSSLLLACFFLCFAEFLIDFFSLHFTLVLRCDFSAYCGTFDTYLTLYWLLMICEVGNKFATSRLEVLVKRTDNKITCFDVHLRTLNCSPIKVSRKHHLSFNYRPVRFQ